MNFVVFGLTVSSSWGNGHATLWRGLIRALNRLGHRVLFYERDVPYYAGARDLYELPGGQLRLYGGWDEIIDDARSELSRADVAMITSYCPDGRAASRAILDSAAGLKVFYDLDTPVTLQRLADGDSIPYLPPRGLADFDLVLSYTGGQALQRLRTQLGARHVAPLYGHVDPHQHHPVPPQDQYRSDLSYLGAYAADRQKALEELFVKAAQQLPERRFLIGGALYPHDFPWAANIHFVRHMPPDQHSAMFCSSRLTLNVTRGPMATLGYCPSGRLFKAAACGTPIITDWWEGLDEFFLPRQQIIVAHNTQDVVNAMEMSDRELARIAEAAYVRVLTEHSSDRRAEQLQEIISRKCSHTSATPAQYADRPNRTGTTTKATEGP